MEWANKHIRKDELALKLSLVRLPTILTECIVTAKIHEVCPCKFEV